MRMNWNLSCPPLCIYIPHWLDSMLKLQEVKFISEDLHSTLVRFYGKGFGCPCTVNETFTFHTGQILWRCTLPLGFQFPYLHSTLVRFYEFTQINNFLLKLHLHSTLVRFYGLYLVELCQRLISFTFHTGQILWILQRLHQLDFFFIYIPHWLDSMGQYITWMPGVGGFTFHTGQILWVNNLKRENQLLRYLHSTLVRFYVKKFATDLLLKCPFTFHTGQILWANLLLLREFIQIYIPHWLDSMQKRENLLLFRQLIYIPHWLDSMLICSTWLESTIKFTFHTGQIL